MKKLFLLIALLSGCSTVHGVKVQKDLDASSDVSAPSEAYKLSDAGILQINCNEWCSINYDNNIDASTKCLRECHEEHVVRQFADQMDDQ